jgi:dolichyl-phosphate-mannose--protein O-mannosyl transferase
MHKQTFVPGTVAVLLAVLLLQLSSSIRRQSQTWDEGCHIFAGSSYWTRADYGMNPEHPPLVKMLATSPLLAMNLTQPAVGNDDFKIEAFLAGDKFVYGNSAGGDTILYRVRMTASLLTVLLALLTFLAAREMFNQTAALLALTLFVFDPNILAHGAYVTTDIALSCFLLATVYSFYRYVKSPGWAGLLLTGVAAGCALATKHSAILLFPILLLLAIAEVIQGRDLLENSAPTKGSRWRLALRYVGALVGIKLVAVAILWAFYGFRYAARPNGFPLNPPLASVCKGCTIPLRSGSSRCLRAGICCLNPIWTV